MDWIGLVVIKEVGCNSSGNLIQRGGIAMAMERLANCNDEGMEGRSSVKV